MNSSSTENNQPTLQQHNVGGSTGYDSAADTLMHIKRVNELLIRFSKDLMYRAICHDNSKLREPEKAEFDRKKWQSGFVRPAYQNTGAKKKG